MKNFLGIVFLLIIIPLIAYSCFKFEKWFNYKFGYEGKIEERIRPLEKRIQILEEKVK